MKRPHSPGVVPFEMLAALCCAAMKPDSTLTEDMVSRKVSTAIKISRSLLCCSSMLMRSYSAIPHHLRQSSPCRASVKVYCC